MTLLASWAAIDTHGISSAYIVSDSRISWGNKKYFDFGKKVFASKKYPEIFGYAGDVLFPVNSFISNNRYDRYRCIIRRIYDVF